MQEPLFVTQPHLPPLKEFLPYLEEIWASKVITNGGHQHQDLERALSRYLDVPYVSLVSNGTLGLIIALQALNVQGEVITTPYSFVATSNALLWNGNTPVFADIDPETLNLDPGAVRAAITPQTTAILAVHCYGTPCQREALQNIANEHGLKLIYDAAHAFGVQHDEQSIFGSGDLSVLSFHATKVFNTFEGGAIVTQDPAIKHHIDQLKNFGFVDEVTVEERGINGKMSEVNAAFGLLQLKHMDAVLRRRAELATRYLSALEGIPGIKFVQPGRGVTPNHSYFPIRIRAPFPFSRDELYESLKTSQIFARRYFYPLISDFPMFRNLASADSSNLPHARAAASEILCLPIYPNLSNAEQDRVINALIEASLGRTSFQ